MPKTTRRHFRGAAGAAGLVVLFCLGLLWRDPGVFFHDDYQISILPTFADIARSWGEGRWPLLCPSSWACGNLAGEYQYGTFSMFINALVVLVWRFPLTFAQQAAALSIAHLAVLAAGAYLLARGRRLAPGLAVMVALVASLHGWMLGWAATDWFGALAALAWLPWCWWAFEKAEGRGQKAEGKAEARRWTALRPLLPVPFVYLLVTAGFPYTVVMLALLTVWLAARTLATDRRGWRALGPLALGWGLGLLLSAPAWLSLLEAIHGSGRSQQGVGAGNTAWTVPPASLPGLILPYLTAVWRDFGNYPSPRAGNDFIGGFVPTVGLIAGLCVLRGRLARAIRWELALLGSVLLLCLLPSPGLFRWSFRWLPLFFLILALAGGRSLQMLAARSRRVVEPMKNPGVWGLGLLVLVQLATRALHPADFVKKNVGLFLVMMALVYVWLGFGGVRAGGRRRAQSFAVAAAITLGSLAAGYSFLPVNSGLPVYRVTENLRSTAPFAPGRLYLSLYREPDQFYRDWQVPRGFGAVTRLGSTGMFAGVPLVNGYSPIMPSEAGKRLAMETHGNVPERVGADLLLAEAGPDGLLWRLGVDGVVMAHDYQTDARPPSGEWEVASDSVEGTLYHRRGEPLGDVRAWTSAEPGGPARYAPASVRLIENSRQFAAAEVSVPAGGPGLVAFRRPYFPGYVAALNGVPVAVGTFRNFLPTVELPAGSCGRLTLAYRPRAVVWGAGLAGVGLLGAAVAALLLGSARAPRAGLGAPAQIHPG